MSETTTALERAIGRIKELEMAEYWLGELLAVIHRDGGHYYDQHGPAKACKDAIQLWYAKESP